VPLPLPPVPSLAGTLKLTSNFNIQTDFTGTEISQVLNILNELTNDPDDPGKFVVDMIFDNLDPSVAQLANVFRSILYSPVNNLLTSLAPDFISGVKQLGSNLSDLARKFTLSSEMISATTQPTDRAMPVTHRLQSIIWNINGKTSEYTFASYGMTNPQVDGLSLHLQNNIELLIPEHVFEIRFGSFLLAGLNTLIIPAINSSASSLTDLMNGWINCREVGAKINTTINLLGDAFWQGACDLSVKALSTYIEQSIVKIDQDQSKLLIHGKCNLTDANNDLFMDTMSNGAWSGSFMLNKNTATIDPAKNTFTGQRTN
jgi:hypothetical protein